MILSQGSLHYITSFKIDSFRIEIQDLKILNEMAHSLCSQDVVSGNSLKYCYFDFCILGQPGEMGLYCNVLHSLSWCHVIKQ